MNRRVVLAIARKDLKAALRNRMVSLPIVLLPSIFLVGFPILAAVLGSASQSDPSAAQEFGAILENAPDAVTRDLARFPEHGRVTAFMLLYTFAPFFLMLPLMTVHALASDAIAGERERRTLEALVYTPTTDAELLAGKLLGAYLPGLAVAWGGFLVYLVTANAAAWYVMGALVLPSVTWLALILWLAPAIAAFALGVMVIVSARAQTQQAAYQTGGFIVLPIILLLLGQISGVLVLGLPVVLAVGAAFWLLDAALLSYGRRYLKRSELLARNA